MVSGGGTDGFGGAIFVQRECGRKGTWGVLFVLHGGGRRRDGCIGLLLLIRFGTFRSFNCFDENIMILRSFIFRFGNSVLLLLCCSVGNCLPPDQY